MEGGGRAGRGEWSDACVHEDAVIEPPNAEPGMRHGHMFRGMEGEEAREGGRDGAPHTLDTPNTAGMESTANTKSDSSMQIKHMNKGVANRFPFLFVKNLFPSYSSTAFTHFFATFNIKLSLKSSSAPSCPVSASSLSALPNKIPANISTTHLNL